jgi:hypothetical protein
MTACYHIWILVVFMKSAYEGAMYAQEGWGALPQVGAPGLLGHVGCVSVLFNLPYKKSRYLFLPQHELHISAKNRNENDC